MTSDDPDPVWRSDGWRPSTYMVEKTRKILLQDRVEEIDGELFEVEGDTDTYLVKYVEETGETTCPCYWQANHAGHRVCSHQLAVLETVGAVDMVGLSED